MPDDQKHSLSHIAASRVRDLREQKGWSLATLARRAGTTAPTIMKLEKMERKLDLIWIERLAAALGVDPLSLFVGSNAGGLYVRLIPSLSEVDIIAFVLKSDTSVIESDFLVPIVSAIAKGPRVFAFSVTTVNSISEDQEGFVVIDPDDKDLQEGNSYALLVESGSLGLFHYQEAPARFATRPETANLLAPKIGQDSFSIVGRLVASVTASEGNGYVG